MNLRQLASNYTFLITGEILSKICTFAAFTFLARVLGPEYFGYLEFTIALIVILTLLVDFGSGPFGAREIAKDSGQVPYLLGNIAILRLLMAIFIYVLLVSFLLWSRNLADPVRVLLMIYGLSLFGIPGLIQWVFQGQQKMKWVAAGTFLRHLIFASSVFLLVRTSADLWKVAWIECASVGGQVLCYVWLFRSGGGKLRQRVSLSRMRAYWLEAMPIGLSELAWAFIWYSATVILGILVGGKSVGWFGAAHRPIMALHTFVWLYFYNLLPSISQSSLRPSEDLQKLMSKSLMLVSWVAVFVGTVGFLYAEPMLTLVFGSEYRAGVQAFRILIWVLSMMMLSGHYTHTLIAYNFQRLHLVAFIIATAVSITLSLVLIPRFQAEGAAFAIVFSMMVKWAIAYYFVNKKIVTLRFAYFLARPIVAGALVVGVYYFIPVPNVFVSGALSIVVYAIVISVIQPQLWTGFRSLFQR